MEGRSISLTGYVAHLGLLADLALSLLQRASGTVRLLTKGKTLSPVLGRPPTHLLHLADAVSSPIIFGLLLRDTGHNTGSHTQPQAQLLSPYQTASPELSPSSPSCSGDDRRTGT